MSWVRVLFTCKLRGLFLASGFECELLKILGFECEPLKILGLECEPLKTFRFKCESWKNTWIALI